MNLPRHYIEHEAMDLDEHILELARQVVHIAGTVGGSSSSSSSSGTPGGSDTQVQFNDGGTFGGDSNFVFNKTTGFAGIGTASPISRLHLDGDVSAAAWGVAGIQFQSAIGTFTDTTSTGTVTNLAINSFNTPTVAASAATTYTDAATLYVQNAPQAGTNVTITTAWAIMVSSGNMAVAGMVAIGANFSGTVLASNLTINGGFSTTAWGTTGVRLNARNRTYTDTSSSGTVASVVIDSFATGTIAASSSTTFTTAATVYIGATPTAGSNVTITNVLALWADAGNVRFDESLSVGTGSAPVGRLTVGGSLSAVAWTTSGIGLRIQAATFTDTTSSGSVTTQTVHTFGIPTLAASSSTTYVNASTVFVSGVPAAGSNVTITSPWAIQASTGNSWFFGLWIGNNGSGGTNRANITISGDVNSGIAHGVAGQRMRIQSRTYTDSVSSGTVASGALDGFATGTVAASSSTTFTDYATMYVAAAPTAGSNVTITNGWSIWADAGNVRIDAALVVGSSSTLISGSDAQITQTTGGILTIGRNDTSVTANDSLGIIRFYANDTSTTTNPYAASIEVIANSTISTDINPGIMIFKTTGTGVAGALTERLRIDAAGAFTIAEAGNFILGTSTGSKIGTAITQKLGFWNATPVIQDTGWTVTNGTTDRTYDADATTIDEVADVLATLISTLKTYGIIGA